MVSLIGGIKEEDKPEIRYAPRLPLRLIKPLLQDSSRQRGGIPDSMLFCPDR